MIPNHACYVEIREPYPCPIFEDMVEEWKRSKSVWEKPNPILEVTMEQIAEKFEVEVKNLKIKK